MGSATEPFSLSEIQPINVNGLRFSLAPFLRLTISEVNGKCPPHADLILQQQHFLVLFHMSLERFS